MANSKLYGAIIGTVPKPVLEYIQTYISNNKGLEGIEGYEHARGLLNNPKITYSQAKKIKNFFSSYSSLNGNRDTYELHGGIRMKKYVEHLLDRVRDSVTRGKQVKGLAFDNQFRKTHNKSFDKAQQLGTLTNFSDTKNKNYISESEMTRPKEASIAFIFNTDGNLLLLQRAKDDDWMPMKWATLGGGVENGEKPEESLVREAKEEANVDLTDIQHTFDKEEDSTYVYVYKAICTNPDSIKISSEHEKYRWVNPQNVHKFNTVPDLLEDLDKILNNGDKQ
jgi:8-oxo-dGTP diphosphatase